MVNYIPLNCSTNRGEYSQLFERVLKKSVIFKYTEEVNAHVLFNFKSPTNELGEYDYIAFIDVPFTKNKDNGKTNRCQWNGTYVNTVAIAVRRFLENDVIDVDKKALHTEEGSWDYNAQIEADRAALRHYVYENFSEVKHFDVAVIYIVKAPNCNKVYGTDVLAFNKGINFIDAFTYAVNLTKNSNGKQTNCLLLKNGQKSAVWSDFLPTFLNIAEEHTHQGILTHKKVNDITKKNTSRLMEQAYNTIGKKLCVIRGKAGTGKTLALLRIMYNQVSKDVDGAAHKCRLLTFNNMLVLDLRQALKSIGDFNPSNASISSIHKFFFDIYKNSPVRELHMDQKKIDSIINLCVSRISKYNSKLRQCHNQLKNDSQNKDSAANLSVLQKEINSLNCFEKEELSEIQQYSDFLWKLQDFDVKQLSLYAQQYVDYKRKVFVENYHRQEFINGYNLILEQMYLIYHNIDEFLNKYKLRTAYTTEELRNSQEFKTRYQEIYNKFIEDASKKFEDESVTPEDLLPDFSKQIEQLDFEIGNQLAQQSYEKRKECFIEKLKSIKRTLNWSKLILVDEAQDCQLYEKALLLELNGSADTVIATGGKDQLIRVPEENDWSVCLGHPLIAEKITLRSVSHRQKGNIIMFLNAFAKSFGIDTELKVKDELENTGRVVIDCRTVKELGIIPHDKIKELYIGGKDHGCSNFENFIFLLPQEGYVKKDVSSDINVSIDTYGTININKSSGKRKLNIALPSYLKAVDGTVNDKRVLLNNTGQDNTRCILYESCRGLEAWNVACIDIDSFYYDRILSHDAEVYANTNSGGLFEDDIRLFKERYAALWCYMAMTRAIDTLYIKLSNPKCIFALKIIAAAKTLPNIEILEGEYTKEDNA